MITTTRASVLFVTLMALIGSSPVFAADTSVGTVLESPQGEPAASALSAIDDNDYAKIFEGLTRIDQYGEVQPSLATSWWISKDALKYTFTLKSRVKFHNGERFDSRDVAFSFKRAMSADNSDAKVNAIFEPFGEVRASDPETVIITLKRPTDDFLLNLGRQEAVIVSRKSADSTETNLIGTGPFKFVRWDEDGHPVLEKWDGYMGE